MARIWRNLLRTMLVCWTAASGTAQAQSDVPVCFHNLEARGYKAFVHIGGRPVSETAFAPAYCDPQIKVWLTVPFQRADYPRAAPAAVIEAPSLQMQTTNPRKVPTDRPIMVFTLNGAERFEKGNIPDDGSFSCHFDNGTGVAQGETSRFSRSGDLTCLFPTELLEGATAARTRIFVRHDPTGAVVFDGDVMSGMPTGFLDNIGKKQRELIDAVNAGQCKLSPPYC